MTIKPCKSYVSTLTADDLADIEAAAAAAPLLTVEQIAELRRILRPDEMLVPRMASSVEPSPGAV